MRWWADESSTGEEPVDWRSLAWLIAALAATTSGHLPNLPLWLPVICVALAVWRLRAAVRGATGVPRTLRWTLALGLLGVLALAGSVGWGLQTALPMFVAFLWLKLVEVERRRDLIRVGFLAYFLAAAHLLIDGAAVRFALAFLGIAVTTAALVQAHRDPRPGWGDARLLAGGLPVAALLFLVVPRAPLGLVQGGAGSSGINDRMNPYDLAKVAQDPAVAFRAEVLTGQLAPTDFWWRAMVLWHCDGATWWRGAIRPVPARTTASGPVQVRLDIAPNRERWLPSLETSLSDPGSRRTLDGMSLLAAPLSSAKGVDQWADPQARQTDQAMLRAALDVPEQVDPRVQALADRLRSTGDDLAVIGAVERWFADNGFQYTLEPGAISGDQLAGFLFGDKRTGFCAHFAGSGAMLLRLAGVPARVVVGYRGGETNPITGQILIRRSNAHAWIEAWSGARWERLDPTAKVPLLPGQKPPPGTAGASTPGAPPPDDGFAGQVARPFRNALDAVESQWLRLVIAFDSDTQLDWLRRLGLGQFGWWGLVMVAIPALLLPILFWWWWSRRRLGGPVGLEREWQRLQRRLTKAGWNPRPDEGPDRLAQRLSDGGAHEAAAVCRDLATLSYAPQDRHPDHRGWIRRARRVKVAPVFPA